MTSPPVEIPDASASGGEEVVTYADYLRLDAILSAQHPRSDQHDEVLFLIIHQTTELWIKQMLHELEAAKGLISAGRVEPALKALARVSRIQSLITQSWDILSTLTPTDYLTFRDRLGSSSGFQSHQFRALEFILGLKSQAHLTRFDAGTPERAALDGLFNAPSLYDVALHRVAAAGVAVPSDVIERDVRTPYERHDGVEAAWLSIYRAPQDHWDLYALAEKLMDLEDAFRVWRFRHVTTVERIIGRKIGTGGSSGVDYLMTGFDRYCFPELWSLRTKL